MDTTNNSAKQPKEVIIHLYNHILNKRRFEDLEALIADQYTGTKGIKGVAGFQQSIKELISAFPDIQWSIVEIVAEGNKVMLKQVVTGTHSGVFLGIAATAKNIRIQAYATYEFEAGKIIRSEVLTDRISLFQQLGVSTL
ncbi:ester cyclase [Chitinophaga rhizophila]|uniref:Ester cyclase n=1 Tax=Chitinophaga rhizophila TaxID=2866212 RepID=A0ABS7G8B4_9BACT|nr:ester cyclase [Chitinophaga rhizophila]MBW8683889.1 ester cyclase [Chitinophaga rhizophila]